MNRSVTLQLWLIAALVPAAFLILMTDAGGSDFTSFWAAGKQALTGADVYAHTATQDAATAFVYPPHALFFFVPFALLPVIPSYWLWNAATASLFYWGARPYCPKGFPRILAVLTPAALICFTFGQSGLLFGALWLLAFRGKWAAVALLTFKPHLGLIGILSLKDRRSVTYCAILVVVLVAASAAIFGPGSWVEFVSNSIGQGDRMGRHKRWLFAGVSPAIAYGLVGWAPFAIAGALLLARRVNVFTAATASLIISPYGFHYDMPVVCLGFGLLIYERWDEMLLRHRIPVALGFLSPVIAIGGAWWMPPILLWALWGQVSLQYDILASPLEPAAELQPQI